MQKKGRIAKYTDKELTALEVREGTHSDWDRAAKMVDSEIEALVASDPDEDHMELDWDEATTELS